MNNFYDWKPEYNSSFLAIMSISICFAAYWFIAFSPAIKKYYFKKYDEHRAWVRLITFQKMMAVLFMGVIPGSIIFLYTDYTFYSLGFNLNNWHESLMYVGAIGGFILIANYFASQKQSNLDMYPQMRIKVWDKKTLAIDAFGWTSFMLAYEFMYRGLLLKTCYDSFGFWPAVAINLSFYSATHIAKGLRETIGTFPYGLALCFITISTGSILTAFVTHVILALSNDFYSIHHHPDMRYA